MKNVHILVAISSFCLNIVWQPLAMAADYPSKPIRLIIGFTPGGVTDIIGRIAADGLSRNLGQSVIIDNKPGASGEIAYNTLASSKPDGYTLMVSTNGISALPFTNRSFKADPVKDFAHIVILNQAPLLLVATGSMPFADVNGMIAWAKANPGKLNFGVPASSTDLDFAELWTKTGLKPTTIPFKGTVPLITVMLSGDVPVGALSHRVTQQFLADRKLKAIGFASLKRYSLAPDIPTISEQVPGFSASVTWMGISAPKALPQDIHERLNRELNAIISEPANRRTIVEKVYNEVVGGSSQEMVEEIRSDLERYRVAVKITGFQPD